MIEVKEVKTKNQIREFVEFPLSLYKNNPWFVPPLFPDEMRLFKKKNLYSDQAETVYYNAYKDGKIVGRISGILQLAANKKWGQKRVRFTRFDSIDDKEVAKALFSAVETWAKEKGMEEVVGPLGFSDLDREGLLIDGFEYLSTFEEQYNFPYYQNLIESLDYKKDVDWVERRLFYPKDRDERIERVSKMMLEKYHLHFAKTKNINEFIKKYGDQFFEIIDTTYDKIYGTVPFTTEMKKDLISSFKLIARPEYVPLILDENGKIVCFGIGFPAIGKALQKSGGKLTLPTIFRVLKEVNHPTAIDLGLIGVLPEYAKKGVATAIINTVLDMLKPERVEYAETNLNLEENHAIQNQWKAFDSIQHKRRRCYIKKL